MQSWQRRRGAGSCGVALSALHTFLIISSLKYFWQLELLSGEALTNTAVFHEHAEPPLFHLYIYWLLLWPHYTHTHRGAWSTIQATLGTSLVARMVKNLPAIRKTRFDARVGMMPWRRKRLPTPVFLPGEFHGQRSLMSYSPWGCKESDTTFSPFIGSFHALFRLYLSFKK